MSEATTDTAGVVALVEGPEITLAPWPIYTTAKAVGVKNRGSQDIEIQPPGSYNRVTVKVDDKEEFHVEGRYTGRYPGTKYDAFSFTFENGNVSVEHGKGTAPGANIRIYITIT
ncbi:hypothetical protein PTI98_000033 [Pleurotus ostreatus]|nr:hypothetical protein PTI98_000033 [Pleurotus ostreatus]